jgi:CBS domain containing-hemolysin-like protein
VTGWALVAALALLLVNAFFVAVEFALIAARRTQIEPLAAEGGRRARLALASMQELSLQLAGAQLGITMASLGLGFVAEPAVAHLIEEALHAVVELPAGVLHTISFIVALSIVVFLHMVLGEMVPKNIAIAGPERALLLLAVPNWLYVRVFRYPLWLLNGLANLGVRALGVQPRDELSDSHSTAELSSMLSASRDEGLLEEFEHALLRGALTFGERTTSSVMLGRDAMVTVQRWATIGEIEQVVVATGHSRLPFVNGGLDAVVGFVHAKDLLNVPPDEYGRRLPARLIRRMLLVPPTQSLEALLLSMRQERIHVAVVVDEGRTLGMVTLEDLLEELVGDIRDETDIDDEADGGAVRPRSNPENR